MGCRLALVAIVAIASASTTPAHANGRWPASVNVHLGPNGRMLVPVTFGLLLSTDGGSTIHWVCEDALGYGGTYDPDYAITPDGFLWTSVFDGLRVSDDGGCTWTPYGAPFDEALLGFVEADPEGNLWVGASSNVQIMWNGVFVLREPNGVFERLEINVDRVWWTGVQVAPSDPMHVYVSGYVVSLPTDDGGLSPPAPILYHSGDGGGSWAPMSTEGFEFGTKPVVVVEAVSPVQPTTLFVRAEESLESGGDALYRSVNAGQSWTKILERDDRMVAVHIRPGDSTMVVGTKNAGVVISTDGGDSWQQPSYEPRMGCIGEGGGTLFACGENWAPDGFSIGSSTDAMTWTKVFQFSDIVGPLSCDPGTVQHDTCELQVWPDLAVQLGMPMGDGGPLDAGPSPGDGGEGEVDGGGGGGGGRGCDGCNVALGLLLLLAPRRRRSLSPRPVDSIN